METVTLAIALLANVIRPKDIKGFTRLQRPRWLTFQKLIPVIWTTVFICGDWVATYIGGTGFVVSICR